MLFSEPKIPQSEGIDGWSAEPTCFSALQRAENSSIFSSPTITFTEISFSALQRAENSSMSPTSRQKSPASRVSVLFSEPKIPQCDDHPAKRHGPRVSVLFSEPKIPQYCVRRRGVRKYARFSALQRAENSSIFRSRVETDWRAAFQCSSASRKFLNQQQWPSFYLARSVSVLFSEPKIPQSERMRPQIMRLRSFSALQRAENSSIQDRAGASSKRHLFQCSSASRKFLNLANRSAVASLLAEFQCSSASRKFLNGRRCGQR